MQWWEIYVQAPESMSDVVSEYLHRLGSSAVVVHDMACLLPQQKSCVLTVPHAAGWTVLQGALPVDTHFDLRLRSLQEFLHARSGGCASPPWKLYCHVLLDAEYLTQWQRFFQPLSIGQCLYIRPPWDTTPIPHDMACLTLEPGLAFGTGSHPTTHLCLTMLTQCITGVQEGTLLDIGCGSGILSLAALQLGLRTAVGVDIDTQAVAVAQRNAVLNSLQHRVRFLQGSWEVAEEQSDVITANIYLGPLVNMADALAKRLRPHGTLILSGILTSQEGTLRTALDGAQLDVHQRLVEDGWVALAVRHSDRALRRTLPA